MRYSFDEIKASKNFYRDNYRAILTALLVSIGLNIFLGLLVVFFKLTQDPGAFYASNAYGITELNGLDDANYSDTPLLMPDPDEESMQKELLVD